jgi:hypothetical protein
MRDHGPGRIRKTRCRRCGRPLTDCLIDRAVDAPAVQQYDLSEQYALAVQRERARHWAKGAL